MAGCEHHGLEPQDKLGNAGRTRCSIASIQAAPARGFSACSAICDGASLDIGSSEAQSSSWTLTGTLVTGGGQRAHGSRVD